MTDSEILEQLFENDEVVEDFLIPNSSFTIEIKSINYKDQEELEDFIYTNKGIEMTSTKFLQLYSIELLARTVKTWGKKRFKSTDEARETLSRKPISLLNRLIQAQKELEEKIKKVLKTKETIDETFFPKVEPLKDSDPLQKESTPEKKEALERL